MHGRRSQEDQPGNARRSNSQLNQGGEGMMDRYVAGQRVASRLTSEGTGSPPDRIAADLGAPAASTGGRGI